MLSSTIGQNNLDKLYEVLLGLGMMTVDNILKWDGQKPKLIHMLAISISLLVHSLSLMISLRCLQDSLSSLEVNTLLQLSIAEIEGEREKKRRRKGSEEKRKQKRIKKRNNGSKKILKE